MAHRSPSLTLGTPQCAIRDPMSQHFSKFMLLNADNSFMLSVFLNVLAPEFGI
jgi:hypothetical protein